MTDRVTWETCPICGSPAAVGWTTVAWVAGQPVEDVPDEFDCASGCLLNPEELVVVFEVPVNYN